MILSSSIKQITQEILENTKFDLVIVASGYEERATFLCTKLDLNCQNKVALSFDNYDQIDQRKINDHLFTSKGFSFIKSLGDSDISIIQKLKELSFEQKSEYNILVDYSSMTRVWYSAILNYFRWLDVNKNVKINIFFSYSIAEFTPPPENEIPNKHIGPIKGFYNISLPLKPTALIIGLGYERIRAFGLTEFLDAETMVFLTDSSQEKFTKEVVKENEELLRIVSEDNIFRYSLNKMEHLHYVLNSLCEKLTEKFRIVIAPCGPKPFSLIALLNSILLKDLDVWRISPGTKGFPQNRTANGNIIVIKTVFEK